MSQLVEMVRTVVIYMLLVSAIMHLLPSGEYKKYVRFFTGFLLVVLVVRPLTTIVTGEGGLENIYEEIMEWQIQEEYVHLSEQLEEQIKEATIRTYERQVD